MKYKIAFKDLAAGKVNSPDLDNEKNPGENGKAGKINYFLLFNLQYSDDKSLKVYFFFLFFPYIKLVFLTWKLIDEK